MHERSVTVDSDGKYYNVYGRGTKKAGQPLPKKYPFEKDAYDSVEEAVKAAGMRSEMEGRKK